MTYTSAHECTIAPGYAVSAALRTDGYVDISMLDGGRLHVWTVRRVEASRLVYKAYETVEAAYLREVNGESQVSPQDVVALVPALASRSWTFVLAVMCVAAILYRCL